MDEETKKALDKIDDALLAKFDRYEMQSFEMRCQVTAHWRGDPNAATVTCIEGTLSETLGRLLDAKKE